MDYLGGYDTTKCFRGISVAQLCSFVVSISKSFFGCFCRIYTGLGELLRDGGRSFDIRSFRDCSVPKRNNDVEIAGNFWQRSRKGDLKMVLGIFKKKYIAKILEKFNTWEINFCTKGRNNCCQKNFTASAGVKKGSRNGVSVGFPAK